MEIFLSVVESLAIAGLCAVLGVSVYILLDVRRFKETEVGKANERLEELIASREAEIAALEGENNELRIRLDEYRAFGIMHPEE